MWAGGTTDVRAWELVFRATELKDREIYEDNLEGRRLYELPVSGVAIPEPDPPRGIGYSGTSASTPSTTRSTSSSVV